MIKLINVLFRLSFRREWRKVFWEKSVLVRNVVPTISDFNLVSNSLLATVDKSLSSNRIKVFSCFRLFTGNLKFAVANKQNLQAET